MSSVVNFFFGDLPHLGVGHLDVLYLSLMINYSLLRILIHILIRIFLSKIHDVFDQLNII